MLDTVTLHISSLLFKVSALVQIWLALKVKNVPFNAQENFMEKNLLALLLWRSLQDTKLKCMEKIKVKSSVYCILYVQISRSSNNAVLRIYVDSVGASLVRQSKRLNQLCE
jgi:hypothetical protein